MNSDPVNGPPPVADIAYVRFQAPNLDTMEDFLSSFGLRRARRTADELHMAAADGSPFVHATRLGEPAFKAVGFRAASREALDRLAETAGAAIEPTSDPGGGDLVRLTDPDGLQVEVIHWSADAPPETPERTPLNDAVGQLRVDVLKRLNHGPSTVMRIGHVVLEVSDYDASAAWYRQHLGLIPSDEIYREEGGPVGAAFFRCDQGPRPVDHHTVVLAGRGKFAFGHAAFEVVDFDDLMTGHDHLRREGREHDWGVGRHILGGQIFDYWRDPWGHLLEHWTDGDMLTRDWGSRRVSADEVFGAQWGKLRAEL
jgi:catechol 2,3-dioxygenase-like lactoylglutathione lyase family enzyme